MKKLLTFYVLITIIVSCSTNQNSTKSLFVGSNKEAEPLSGSNWGEIRNGSVEDVISDKVDFWTINQWSRDAQLFYDSQAHDGTKSLCASADGFAAGEWINKVNLKPWSKYRFTGWIKTEGIVSQTDESGVGFRLTNVEAQMPLFNGDNDWTEVSCEFETGANDCTILVCAFGAEGPVKGKVWFDDMSLELISYDHYSTSLKIDLSEQGPIMSDYIYGQFIEHLGKCIYGGIWAEMVMDRKFWYNPGHRESPWKITGKQATNEMYYIDTFNPYTGKNAPVLCSESNDVALEQAGLGVNAGIAVTGYVILKSDRKMAVNVELVMDDQVEIAKIEVEGGYKKYDVAFAASSKKVKDALLRIAPIDNGKLWVGTISLMPDNNVEGFRPDVLELLRGLNSPVYRWPGGNFVSGYDWKDGIGNRDQRPPRKNPAWTGVESNDVGIHEFIKLCELLGTEPYIAVNAGLGGVKSSADEVEYCNGGADTPMGRLRAANGHPEPWGVKWWSVGNEMFGDWQLGFMSTEAFVEKHNSFADAMRKVDPSIRLIAVGNVGPWDEMVMANCSNNMDLISEHFYCQDWNGTGLMTHVSQLSQNIKRISDAHREYRQTIPALDGKDIRICMDEWNYWYGPHIYGELGTRYYLRDGLGVAAGLNEFLRNSDMIFMANYAQTVNVIGCIKATTTDACYATTGEVLKMYREHFGTIPVKLEGELRPFDAAAAINPINKTLAISIVNPTYEDVTFDLDLIDKTFTIDGTEYTIDTSTITSYVVTGPDDMAYNTPGYEQLVQAKEKAIKRYNKITVSPFSANIITISYR